MEIYNIFKTNPALNQIETHIHFQQKKMHDFLQKYNCIHKSYSHFGGKGATSLKDKTLVEVAKKYNISPAQIVLRYLLQLDIVIIPKTVNLF